MRANTEKMINVIFICLLYTLYSRLQLLNRLNMVKLATQVSSTDSVKVHMNDI